MTLRRTIARTAAAVGFAAVVFAGTAPNAAAVPEGGASPDTPGTSATVSPSSVAAGGTISFTVSGFPAGETLYVKIDDGENCTDAAVHGACVYHQQKIPSSGTVTGKFALPADLAAGPHWLRFLASAVITDSNGQQIGVKGYTSRGNADFVIVAAAPAGGGGAAAAGSTGASSGGATPTTAAPTNSGGGTANAAPGASPSGATSATGGSVASGDAPVAADGSAADDGAIGVVPLAASDTTEPVADDVEVEEIAEAATTPGGTVVIDDDGGAPVAGIAALAGAIVVAGGAMVVVRKRS